MLNKKNRISNRKLIEKTMRKGAQYKNKYFVFRFLPSKEADLRCAVIVSKKIAPKAVERNYLRRRVNEAVRLNKNLVKNGILTVIIAKYALKTADYKNLNQGIVDFLNQQ